MLTTNAIVLSKIRYRDNDLIIKCYTQEKGLVIILFGLFTALICVYVTRNYFKPDSYLRRTIPIYPFMAFSLIIIGIISGLHH